MLLNSKILPNSKAQGWVSSLKDTRVDIDVDITRLSVCADEKSRCVQNKDKYQRTEPQNNVKQSLSHSSLGQLVGESSNHLDQNKDVSTKVAVNVSLDRKVH